MKIILVCALISDSVNNIYTLSVDLGGSVVAARRPSCSKACGILVLQPGVESVSPALAGGFFTTEPPGEAPHAVCMPAC